MYCPKCGTQNPDSSVECIFCGTSLKSQVDQQPKITEEPEPQDFTESYKQSFSEPNSQNYTENNTQNQFQPNSQKPMENNLQNQFQPNSYQGNNNYNYNNQYSGQSPRIQEYVPNNLGFSIAILVFSVFSCCCSNPVSLILSIIAVVFSSQVNSSLEAGDVRGAEKLARNSKILTWISLGFIIFALLVWILLICIGAASPRRPFNGLRSY